MKTFLFGVAAASIVAAGLTFECATPASAAAMAVYQAQGVITSIARGNEGTDLKITVNGVSTRFWFDNAGSFAINGHQPDCQGMDSFGEFTSGKMPNCPGWAPVTIGKTSVRISYHKSMASGAVVLVADSLTTH